MRIESHAQSLRPSSFDHKTYHITGFSDGSKFRESLGTKIAKWRYTHRWIKHVDDRGVPRILGKGGEIVKQGHAHKSD